ncbi:MAG: type II toxin-antitoxin system RelE/ParE family toxin [Firmicutes bacterium]|jgi:mRNA interferase RelE/StbE|nr:type II toxin-antitoxin system RelE/ParE family toxin [Bacillota bacterium]
MDVYRIFFKRSVEKDLKSVPAGDLKRILARIRLLAKNPRPLGSEKLTGQDRYRLRQGPYRIVYSVQDDELTVWIVKVSHRKDAYR